KLRVTVHQEVLLALQESIVDVAEIACDLKNPRIVGIRGAPGEVHSPRRQFHRRQRRLSPTAYRRRLRPPPPGRLQLHDPEGILKALESLITRSTFGYQPCGDTRLHGDSTGLGVITPIGKRQGPASWNGVLRPGMVSSQAAHINDRKLAFVL